VFLTKKEHNSGQERVTEMEKRKLDILDCVQLRAEDSWGKYHMTKDAGKRKPWRIRTYRTAKHAVTQFVSDVIVAIKTIIKEVM